MTANGAIISYGGQPAKGTAATTFYRHRALATDLGANDPAPRGPAEIGGIPVPSFVYKSGPFVAGSVTIQPRLEDVLGWILFGALGDVSTVETGVGTGIFDHTFKMKAADPNYVPYMTFRKALPRIDGGAATDLGEIYKDCKIVGFGAQFPADAPLTARLDILGREFAGDADPTAWTYANDYEDWESIPVGCHTSGFIKVDGVELPVVAMSVGWQNTPVDLRQERIYGDPFLEAIEIVERSLNFDITVKWRDPALYQKVSYGGAGNTTWGPKPYTGSLDVMAVSTGLIPTETEAYSLNVKADEVALSLVGGIQLAANQSIMMRFQGQALNATNYASFILRNAVTGYTWPV